MKHYEIEVTFSNEGETYGEETYYVEAAGISAATKLGRLAAEDSMYDDPRIPDRSIDVEATEIEYGDLPEGAELYQPKAAPAP